MLLSVENLRHRFGGIAALDGVGFAVPEGRITCLIGPNGSGKTTLFNVVTGVLRPQHGRVSFGGIRLERLRPHQIVRLGLARTFQTTRLFPSLTVLQNVLLAAPSRVEKRNRTKALAQLELVGLAHLEDRLAEALSFGQQRLVEFARALMADPRLILLDEPFAGLAPAILDRLARLVSAMPGHGVAVLLIEHNLEVALGLAAKVFVLDRGRLIAEGTADEIRASPAVIDAYLGAPGAFSVTDDAARA
ncbi:MAG: ABC transporter ATP-binding protein [Alphaproteobacteria bacterium]|nr:ABC transporter ATP-binding protein [Alphaproteobacteria bacterium]